MIIIDANQMGLFVSSDGRIMELLEALDEGKIVAAIGGSKLLSEYEKNHGFYDYIVELRRAGKIYNGDDAAIDELEETLSGLIESDDPHIIAVARNTGARLLCSDDITLHRDFTNKRFLDKPRGKVWHSSRVLKKAVRVSLIDWCCDMSRRHLKI